jgi:DNA-directed RNA polymerase subunit RPC12/RpoP
MQKKNAGLSQSLVTGVTHVTLVTCLLKRLCIYAKNLESATESILMLSRISQSIRDAELSGDSTVFIKPGITIHIDPREMFADVKRTCVKRKARDWFEHQASLNKRHRGAMLVRVKQALWKLKDIENAIKYNYSLVASPGSEYTRVAEVMSSLRCGDCGKVALSQSKLGVHIRTHMEEKEFPCDQDGCNKRFSYRRSMKHHRSTHTGKKSYSCDHDGCGKSFWGKGHLEAHGRTHSGERPYPCNHCGCGKRFSQSSTLKRHQSVHTGEKGFACDHEGCGKSFSEGSTLRKHVLIHTGEKLYDCQECTKRFTQTGTLKTHQRTHTDERPYLCQDCGKRFIQKVHLNSHRRTHTGERPFNCQECGRTFSVSDHLKRHAASHEDSTKWKDVCTYNVYSLQLHEQGKGLFPCAKRFPTKSALSYHVKRHHTEEGHNKWPRESEQRLADFFTSVSIPFDRDRVNHISYTACQAALQVEGHKRAFPDFHLISASEMLEYTILLICCNDENQHRRMACEFKRVWGIFHALRLVPEFMQIPVVMIRFNPHPYKKNGVQFAPNMKERHLCLLQTVMGLKERREDLSLQAPNLIYMYYNHQDGESCAEQLDVFKQAADSKVDNMNALNLRNHVLDVIG